MQTKPKLKTALLEFFLTEDTLYTFIVRGNIPELGIDDKEPIVLKQSLSIGEENGEQKLLEIKGIVSYLRARIGKIKTTPQNKHEKYFNETDFKDFYHLGELIFTQELLQYITPYEALYLVPFGDLHHLPLHAMKFEDSEDYVIDRFVVSYLPSASVLQYLQSRRQNDTKQNSQKSILTVGVDYERNVNAFVEETAEIKQLPYWNITDSMDFRKKEAHKEAILQDHTHKDVIHFSTHGFFADRNPLKSGVLLYTGEDVYKIDEDKHAGMILSAQDIFEKMTLDAELVVMSGCVTGESKNKAGDELIGLTRALIYAGASSMIVSLFNILKNVTTDSTTPKAKFKEFYTLWLGSDAYITKAQAFQKYIQQIKKHPRYQHPFYWFSFIFVGDIN
ncbi:MAG: CHAT domain-containing protein [Chitinophagales bacterium]